MNNQTSSEFDHVVAFCRNLYQAKLTDYGTSWRILRPSSLTDQIFIKAKRIRSLQENKLQMVDEGIKPEFVGIFNYAIMSLIQLNLDAKAPLELTSHKAIELYDYYVHNTKELMMAKNHDYGEAWRNMRVSSLTDIILMKLMRLKQIEDNNGVTNVSEGLEANGAGMGD